MCFCNRRCGRSEVVVHPTIVINARKYGAVTVLRGGIKGKVFVHHQVRSRKSGFWVIYKKVIPHNFYA